MSENKPKDKNSFVNSTIYVILTGVIVTVLGQWSVNMIWPTESSTSPSLEVRDVLDQSPISLSRWQELTLQLNRAPDSVRDRLFDDYRGETVTWEGHFDQFNDHSANQGPPSSAVSLIMYASLESLKSNQLLGPPFVRCFFSKQQLATISRLRRGQRIVVRGTLANPVLLGSVLATDLNQCELLAAEDESESLAVIPGVILR